MSPHDTSSFFVLDADRYDLTPASHAPSRTKRRPSTNLDEPLSRHHKRQLLYHLSIEELDSVHDPAYDADIEVRRPDEYSEPDSEPEGGPAAVAVDSPTMTNPASLADDFGKLRCSPRSDERRRGIRRASGVRSMGGTKHKRVHSESLLSETELDEPLDEREVNDQDRSVRRQKRRLDDLTDHRQSGLLIGDVTSPLVPRSEPPIEPASRWEISEDEHRAECLPTLTPDVEEMMDIDPSSP